MKMKLENLKLLFLLRADPYLDNTTDCSYSFRNMQKAELCVLSLCELFQPILTFVTKFFFIFQST